MSAELIRYMPVFVQVAADASFSRTARALGLTPAAVSKTIRVLEDGLETQLFFRSTRGLTLTADGEALLADVAPHIRRVQEALALARSEPEHPHGTLRVAAPYAFSRAFILPLFKGFCERYRDVSLECFFDDRVSGLQDERIDVSIGARLSPSPDLVSKKLCDARVHFVAAPGFLGKHPLPTRPQDLLHLPAIRFRSHANGKLMPWFYLDDQGALARLEPPPRIVVASQELLCELAADGLGVAMAGLVAEPFMRSGKLLPLLAAQTPTPSPISLYYHSKQNQPAKVRAFIDYLCEHIDVPPP